MTDTTAPGSAVPAIYDRLDCSAALRALARGGYRSQRVFFADEPTAVHAGYRPCAVCLPAAYRDRRTTRGSDRRTWLSASAVGRTVDGVAIHSTPAGPRRGC